MGGPSGHGQRNKPHKAGRTAGLSARQKQRLGKEVGPAPRQGAKAGAQGGKLERLAASKKQRESKRNELLEARRKSGAAPIVVALLPLSQAVDVARLWNSLLSACASAGQSSAAAQADDAKQDTGMDVEVDAGPSTSGSFPLATRTIHVAGKGRGVRLTLLPPPSDRRDLMSVVDLGRAAEVVLLAVPGGEHQQAVDEDGKAALSVLRALGLPSIAVAVQGGAAGSGMKERSAAKKRAEKAVCAEVAGDHKVYHADSSLDCQQLVRHLCDTTVSVPVWRQQRPALLVEGAEFRPAEAASSSGSQTGTLLLTAYVRYAGLSANQLIHVPGAGDFQIDCIEGLPTPAAGAGAAASKGRGQGEMDTTGSAPVLLAQHDPEERETLVRENQPEPGDEEQTWPSEQELLDVEKLVKGKARRRKLPAGTSEYQAAWIVDDQDGDEDEEEEEDGEGDVAMGAGHAGSDGEEAPELVDDDEGEDDGLGAMEEDDTEKAAALHRELREKHRQRQREQEQEQQEYPDEVEVPVDVPARVRFQKYRGLKSFRSSPWDAKEWLPQEYARIFAFENFKRAHKRAKQAIERATADLDPCAVAPGALVVVHVVGVPADAAAAVIQRVQASMGASEEHPGQGEGSASVPPMVAFGLMSHEAKLSVLHAGIRKAATFQAPIANKEQLLLVTGVRTFLARPIYSADAPGDKQKMERFLHAGRHMVASIYAPISYGPLPLLAFKLPEDQAMAQGQGQYAGAALAASGSVRSCDPDRIVLKKITLTGYPVRVHRRKATVRFMFHNADDIRWFRPIELYTKYGRRGRITEPIGTHGAMKCLFDAALQQRDAVCMSLYKRAFPKWQGSDQAFA